MPQVEQSIEIHAPVNDIFALVAHQPERMSEWWPPLEQHERVSTAPTQVGSVTRYVYNMMGVRIPGEQRITHFEENRCLILKTISGIDSVFRFDFTPKDGHADTTIVTIHQDYKMPGSVLGQLLNRSAIEDKTLRDLRDGLRQLKAIIELENK
jgi:uncharacterized membrane protein